ncbi:MAG: single-stranded DNA-binding protein [Gimesia sp.]|jgi:single-strand DNA-binding protein|uniref:Single-stranded DNA-binding protein n=1 Tax=Gimesia maris TaxID=122 RepID=A0A3D3R0L6_9PLAN|nr:single-stranded DNA-binding protein [Gimesia sp.]HCO21778.1 single-stranded DNA-binding protein [Gimesia maris]|tara:strand:- start:14990 stop:15481 length:492 start_codon:yes stop_codon:yes gene_type:complete
MASFNKVILVGNLTRDPQVRYTPGGSAVAEIGLAVNRSWFDKNSNSRKEETTFVDVTLWGRTAEVASEYLTKGRSVLIEGRLQLDQWDDKESGQKRSKLKVVGENMTMLGGKGESGGGGGAPSGGGGGYASRGSAPSQGGGSSPADSFYDDTPGGIPDDDVPF